MPWKICKFLHVKVNRTKLISPIPLESPYCGGELTFHKWLKERKIFGNSAFLRQRVEPCEYDKSSMNII